GHSSRKARVTSLGHSIDALPIFGEAFVALANDSNLRARTEPRGHQREWHGGGRELSAGTGGEREQNSADRSTAARPVEDRDAILALADRHQIDGARRHREGHKSFLLIFAVGSRRLAEHEMALGLVPRDRRQIGEDGAGFAERRT